MFRPFGRAPLQFAAARKALRELGALMVDNSGQDIGNRVNHEGEPSW